VIQLSTRYRTIFLSCGCEYHSITASQKKRYLVFSIRYSVPMEASQHHRITESQHHKKNGIQYSVFRIRSRWKKHRITASQDHRITESQNHRITASQKKRYSVFSIRYSVPMEASQHHSITESQKKRYSVFSIRSRWKKHRITASQDHRITKKTVFSIQYSVFGSDGRITESQYHSITDIIQNFFRVLILNLWRILIFRMCRFLTGLLRLIPFQKNLILVLYLSNEGYHK